MTNIVKRNNTFLNDIDHFFNSLFPDFPRRELASNVEGFPVTNVFVNENGDYKLEVAVTGFNRDELDVSVEDGCIVIRGEKKEEREIGDWKFVAGRLKHESFSKRYRLSNRLDWEKTDVNLKDGMLTVIIPAREDVKPKQIEIRENE